MTDPNGTIRTALFRSPGPVIERAIDIVEEQTGHRPAGVDLTWLGRRTALVAYYDADGHARTLTLTDNHADELRTLEAGPTP